MLSRMLRRHCCLAIAVAAPFVCTPTVALGAPASHLQQAALEVVDLHAMAIFSTKRKPDRTHEVLIDDVLIYSQRITVLAKSALRGGEDDFQKLFEARIRLGDKMRALKAWSDAQPKTERNEMHFSVIAALGAWERLDAAVDVLVRKQRVVENVGLFLGAVNQFCPQMTRFGEEVTAALVATKADARHIAAGSQLTLLVERINRNAHILAIGDGVDPEVALFFSRDLNALVDLTDALLNGSAVLRISPVKPQVREPLMNLIKMREQLQRESHHVLKDLQGLVEAQVAIQVLVRQNEEMFKSLIDARQRTEGRKGLSSTQG